MKPVKLINTDIDKAKLTKAEIKMLSDMIASLIISGKADGFLKSINMLDFVNEINRKQYGNAH